MQIILTYRNILRNVKRRVLHTRASAMYYITRRFPEVGFSRYVIIHRLLTEPFFSTGGQENEEVCFWVGFFNVSLRGKQAEDSLSQYDSYPGLHHSVCTNKIAQRNQQEGNLTAYLELRYLK